MNRKTQTVRVRESKAHRILNAGAHRGAEENLSAFERHNRATAAGPLLPVYVDLVPGRAAKMAQRATGIYGVRSEAIEGRAEEIIEGAAVEAVVVNVDDPDTVARVVAASTRLGLPAMGYLAILLPDDRLMGVSFALPATDEPAREGVRAFFGGLARVTAPGGSAEIFGDRADSRHRLVEPLLRDSFARHAETELSRLVAGVRPEHAPLEATFDGRRVHTLHVVVRDTYGDPEEVAAKLLEEPRTPVRRGTTFLVAQVTPRGIRLDEARYRVTDGALAVREAAELGGALAARLLPAQGSSLARAVRQQAPQASAASSLLGALALGMLARAAASSSAVEPVRSDTLTPLSPVLTTD